MAHPVSTTRRSTPAWVWWLATAAFAVGVALGAVIVGLLSEGSSDNRTVTAQDPTTATSSPTQAPDAATSVAASGEVEINQACLDAIGGAQAAYDVIDDIADAAQRLDARRLDEIVRSLQPLQDQLTADVDTCNITATLPGDPSTPSTIAGDLSTPAPTSPSSSAPTS